MCVCVALVIQNVQRMCCIILSSVACLYRIRHYLTNGSIFGKKLLNIKCVVCFLCKFCLE
jgi:hypothetical protein